jgi:nucleotide-binding universal stress UspA family protein
MNGIVVGLDGSPASSRALLHAIDHARGTGSTVRALHVWSTPKWMGGVPGFAYNVLASPEESWRFAKELAHRQVEDARSLRPDAGVDVVEELVEGSPRQLMTKASRTAELVVVGSHGEGRVQGLLLGSVTQYLLSHTACPVMLVPGGDDDGFTPVKVVVGADGSPSARAAMRWALDVARRRGCPLVVVHGWLLTTVHGSSEKHYVPSLREYEAECQEWLDKEVQEVIPDQEGVQVRTELSYSSPVTALRDAAGKDDLLVVGRCGRGGFPGMLLGSVASQCAHYAEGPMVVVPQ